MHPSVSVLRCSVWLHSIDSNDLAVIAEEQKQLAEERKAKLHAPLLHRSNVLHQLAHAGSYIAAALLALLIVLLFVEVYQRRMEDVTAAALAAKELLEKSKMKGMGLKGLFNRNK